LRMIESLITSLADFGIDPVRGFLPATDPLRRLPAYYATWDDLGADLPALLLAGQARRWIERLPELDVARLEGAAEDERALLLLSTFASAYVWGGAEPETRLPRVVAVPLWQLAERMGRQPIVHHGSNVLQNWRRLDPAGALTLENLAMLQGFLTGSDEAWFILDTLAVEVEGADAPPQLLRAQQAIHADDPATLAASLERLATTITRMDAALARMTEQCDPHIFYTRVRPFFSSWPAPGVVYEGVSDAPVALSGGSAGQSALVQALDAALGVRHPGPQSHPFIYDMRRYMPPGHRRFVEALEHGPDVRAYVAERQASEPQLADRYNRCVELLDAFRYRHLRIAVDYITHQAPPGVEATGTGGTDLRAFLGRVKKETRAQRVDLTP
jgi:indoleamine 2,3-dioxygenase